MPGSLARVTSLSPDGIATTEDGRRWQVVLAGDGALGLVPYQTEDTAAVDQERPEGTESWPPSLASLGLDQHAQPG